MSAHALLREPKNFIQVFSKPAGVTFSCLILSKPSCVTWLVSPFLTFIKSDLPRQGIHVPQKLGFGFWVKCGAIFIMNERMTDELLQTIYFCVGNYVPLTDKLNGIGGYKALHNIRDILLPGNARILLQLCIIHRDSVNHGATFFFKGTTEPPYYNFSDRKTTKS